MALSTWTAIDSDECLLLVTVDEAKADGAITQVEATNRRDTPLTLWAVYRNRTVTQVIAPGETFTQTFAGASAKAGDVSSYGTY